jgi:hypothetical protein
MLSMLYILIALIATFSAQVHIFDVNVLTLYANEYTSGYRKSPIPQLRCRGSACAEGALKSMQCTNMGFDGTDANWDCKADVGNRFTLGKVSVSCEGFEFPDDPRILVGSCGVEYELQFNSNYQGRNRDATVTTWWDPLTNRYFNTYSHHNEAIVALLSLFVVLGLILCVAQFGVWSHREVIYTARNYSHTPSYHSPIYHPPAYYDPYPRSSYWPSWSYWTSPVPVARTTYSTSHDAPSSWSHSESRGARTSRR